MVDACGSVGSDGEGVEFAVRGLRNEGEIVFVADDLGDFEIDFLVVLRSFRKVHVASRRSGEIA